MVSLYRDLKQALSNSLYKDDPHLRINIYSPSGILMHRTIGNFKRVCLANKLPFYALTRTYRYGTKIEHLNRREYKKYEGWYARIVDRAGNVIPFEERKSVTRKK